MTQAITLDATIVVAIISLFGVIYTSKMSMLTEMNKQLMIEMKELKAQHTAETERLENKISILTEENIELKNQIFELKLVLKTNEIKEESKKETEKEILKENLDRCVRIPMSDKVRSLNLSNCAALTIYEVLRQQDYPNLSKVEVQKGEEFLYDL